MCASRLSPSTVFYGQEPIIYALTWKMRSIATANRLLNEANPYTVLEIDIFATPRDIKKSHDRLVREAHPDKGGDSERFKLISPSKDLPLDSYKRQALNVFLRTKELTIYQLYKNLCVTLDRPLLDTTKPIYTEDGKTIITYEAQASPDGTAVNLSDPEKQLLLDAFLETCHKAMPEQMNEEE